MKQLKIATSSALQNSFTTEYEVIDIKHTDFVDIGAVVVDLNDAKVTIEQVEATGFGIPIFIAIEKDEPIATDILHKIYGVVSLEPQNKDYYGRMITAAADEYEKNVAPPFFNVLKQYTKVSYSEFDCPGHQGGQFFAKHPAGREFFNFFGENLFRSDLCNADVKFGDLLIHQGPAYEAQKHAAKVYNADKTYFVLNGTSTSNKIVTNALLTQGDLVLFDRNNHKSAHLGALTLCGAKPIYLQTARNPFGFIGGIDEACLDEEYIRNELRQVAPERADEDRPFRLAIIQLATYDGTVYNARQIVDRIGHLCDYILFDSAWLGYDQFIPMMRDCSPLLLELNENDPGIIVTQSVHKQQSGFSQTSQIHKKDHHIKGQKRYCEHKRFNNAFMMHSSTSPFYPMFAALDVNAKIHSGYSGKKLWRDCVKVVIEARKSLLRSCEMIKPFIPQQIDGKPWQDYPTDMIADDIRFFKFEPNEKWHSFPNYAPNQYFVDPCKFMLTTPGINVQTGEYESFGIPATVLANYLRDNGIIPEKCDLNSILFLMTPAETSAKMQHLVALIAQFEKHIKNDSPMEEVLPTVFASHSEYYKGYTIRQLCQKMHDFYARNNIKELQREMFRKEYFPKQALTPFEAQHEFIHNNVSLVALKDIEGKIAAEGALPYPPGILCCVPGEVWGGPVLKYFLALEEGINVLPGFEPEIQGVYLEEKDGHITAYGYVIDKQ